MKVDEPVWVGFLKHFLAGDACKVLFAVISLPIMDLITEALVAGAAAALKDTASDAIKKAYEALKQWISQWLSDKPEAAEALSKIESTPHDEEARAKVDNLISSHIGENPESIKANKLALQVAETLENSGGGPLPPRIGMLIKRLKTRDLKVGYIPLPDKDGIGYVLEDVESESATIGGTNEIKNG